MSRFLGILVMVFMCLPLFAQSTNDSLGLKVVKIQPIPHRLTLFSNPTTNYSYTVGQKLPGGFEVVAFTSNQLSLRKEGKTNHVLITKGQIIPYDEYEVTIADKITGSNFVVRSGSDFSYKSHQLYLLLSNRENSTCILKEVNSSRIYMIGKQ